MVSGARCGVFVSTYVDVEPDLVFLADVGNVTERIERPEYSRPGSCRHEERNTALLFRELDLRVEQGGDHPPPVGEPPGNVTDVILGILS